MLLFFFSSSPHTFFSVFSVCQSASFASAIGFRTECCSALISTRLMLHKQHLLVCIQYKHEPSQSSSRSYQRRSTCTWNMPYMLRILIPGIHVYLIVYLHHFGQTISAASWCVVCLLLLLLPLRPVTKEFNFRLCWTVGWSVGSRSYFTFSFSLCVCVCCCCYYYCIYIVAIDCISGSLCLHIVFNVQQKIENNSFLRRCDAIRCVLYYFSYGLSRPASFILIQSMAKWKS